MASFIQGSQACLRQLTVTQGGAVKLRLTAIYYRSPDKCRSASVLQQHTAIGSQHTTCKIRETQRQNLWLTQKITGLPCQLRRNLLDWAPGSCAQLHLCRVFHPHCQQARLLNAAASSQQTMVSQQNGMFATHGLGNDLSLFIANRQTGPLWKKRAVIKKRGCVHMSHSQRLSRHGQGSTCWRMRMDNCMNIGTICIDPGMKMHPRIRHVTTSQRL